jgi:hypothetical protein
MSRCGINRNSRDPFGGVSVSEAFQLVRKPIEDFIFQHSDSFVRVIQKGTSPRKWVWSAISNEAGDLVESGQYHMYRGILRPMGPGPDLLRLYDIALDELVQLGDIEPQYAEQEKSAIRSNIARAG